MLELRQGDTGSQGTTGTQGHDGTTGTQGDDGATGYKEQLVLKEQLKHRSSRQCFSYF